MVHEAETWPRVFVFHAPWLESEFHVERKEPLCGEFDDNVFQWIGACSQWRNAHFRQKMLDRDCVSFFFKDTLLILLPYLAVPIRH